MKINDIMNGFKILEVKEVAELKGRIVEMKHEKSGARLLWLDRPDNNKTFSIAFRTVPSDDTGIFHILEHSVLCGSKKFPVKEPFVELIKNSMNTFLNAMTFSDKTMYPISSKNDKDFFNLMEVYLDAVFYPSIYTKPEIFYQEGWHYEFDENGDISYKGVVFNEMKGVYADADSVKENALCRALFPDNCYSRESGGHPSKIPSLTYEQFINGHKKYYHPSNSYIILDGDLDIEKVTEFIDREYLCNFDAIEPSELPNIQTPVDAGKVEVMFEQSKDMPLENQSSLQMGYVVGKFDEKEKIYATRILARYLCRNNQSYLTSAILEKGYAEDASIQVVDGILQPYIALDLKNIDENKADEIYDFVNQKLRELQSNGLDKKQLEAVISNFEFELKEKDFGYPLVDLCMLCFRLKHGFMTAKPQQMFLSATFLKPCVKRLKAAILNSLSAMFSSTISTVAFSLQSRHTLSATATEQTKRQDLRLSKILGAMPMLSITKTSRKNLMNGNQALIRRRIWQKCR